MAPRRKNKKHRKRVIRPKSNIVIQDDRIRVTTPTDVGFFMNPAVLDVKASHTPAKIVIRVVPDPNSHPIIFQMRLYGPPYTNPTSPSNPAVAKLSKQFIVTQNGGTFRFKWPRFNGWPLPTDKPGLAVLEFDCLAKDVKTSVTVLARIFYRVNGRDVNEDCPTGFILSPK
jgi:hypothetical protein